MVSVKKILQYLPVQVTQCVLIKVDPVRIIECYFSTKTCIITENTDNTVIMLSAYSILTVLRWEDNLGPISVNTELNEKLSIDLRDIVSK